jgi:hypothetical protein
MRKALITGGQKSKQKPDASSKLFVITLISWRFFQKLLKSNAIFGNVRVPAELLISEIFGDRTKSKLYFTSTGEQL